MIKFVHVFSGEAVHGIFLHNLGITLITPLSTHIFLDLFLLIFIHLETKAAKTELSFGRSKDNLQVPSVNHTMDHFV